MSYILTKTNGQTVAIVEDASVDAESTSLTLIGKNYAGYGLVIDQNFIRLLENFSNNSSPSTPLQGQLWFDSNPSNRRLNVCFDGSNYKSLANIKVQSNRPTSSSTGDLWWDTANGQLKAYDGTRYQTVGPQASSSANAFWLYEKESADGDPSNLEQPFIKGIVNSNPVVVVANLNTDTFTPKEESNLRDDFEIIRSGLTLAGCDANGSSELAGYYFWGTASDALSAKAKVVSTSTNANFYMTFVSSTENGNYVLQTTSTFFFNPSTNVLNVTATAARYADLAERYEADKPYPPATVVVIGGEKEITTTDKSADISVAGVISHTPAYMMNSEAGNDDTHPYVALKGRVKCKIHGPVIKGDLLVTSKHPGYASAYIDGDHPKAIFATALEDFNGEFGIIEVKV
jgi:hypothetical protein